MNELLGREVMKAVNVKKFGWIGLSLVLLTITSCGSDNKAVEVQTTTSSSADTSDDPVVTVSGVDTCQTSTSLSEFRTLVSNMSFIKAGSTREYYNFYECEEKDGWFGIDYNSCKLRYGARSINTELGRVTHESASTVEGVRDHLLSIIDNAVDAVGGGSYYDFESSNGEWNRIYLCQPIVANPTKWRSGDESYSLYSRSF